MKKSITVKQKKIGRGRPRTGSHPMIGLRASPELRNMVEVWAESQEDTPKLSEAIRRLVELGLKVKK
jgi:prephenate dehydrogenase